MRQGRWASVLLMKVQTGLAFFSVADVVFDFSVNAIWAHFTNSVAADRIAHCLEFIDLSGDKPATSSSNVFGESFADLVKEYSSGSTRFIVVDEEIRRLIKSDLNIDSFDGKKNAVREVCWGLMNALRFLISKRRCRITFSQQCPLPLCEGFKVLMKKHQIVIPTEAVDSQVLFCAGSLQRVEELKVGRCREMRKACDKLVPGISGMIKDNFRYVEVMAKILIPSLFEDWDPSKWSTAAEPWFTPEEMKVIMEKDAGADDARKRVQDDFLLDEMIEANLRDYRDYPQYEYSALEELRFYEAKVKRGKKRSHTEMAEQEVVEVAEGRKGGENGAVEVAEGTKEGENGATGGTKGRD